MRSTGSPEAIRGMPCQAGGEAVDVEARAITDAALEVVRDHGDCVFAATGTVLHDLLHLLDVSHSVSIGCPRRRAFHRMPSTCLTSSAVGLWFSRT